MTVLTKVQAAASEQEAAVTDRRRPGRLDTVSPELLPILRGQTPDVIIDFEDADQTAPLRGLLFGIMLSIPLWIAIAYVGSLFLS